MILTVIIVIAIFYGLERLVYKGRRKLAFGLSIALSLPFFVLLFLVAIGEIYYLSPTIVLLCFWCFVTLIEVTRRNLQKQWIRNIISCFVEIPLLYIIFWIASLILQGIPNLFTWVDAKNTFGSMLWHCAIIIAGYIAITYILNKVILTWLMPGGSKYSLALLETEFFIAVYWSSLDVIDGLRGLNYGVGACILFFVILYLWGVSIFSLGAERCVRCHRIGSRYLGSSNNYETKMSYDWQTEVNTSDQKIETLYKKNTTRLVTNDTHECPYCEATWETTHSRVVDIDSTPIKSQITTYYKRRR